MHPLAEYELSATPGEALASVTLNPVPEPSPTNDAPVSFSVTGLTPPAAYVLSIWAVSQGACMVLFGFKVYVRRVGVGGGAVTLGWV